MENVEWISPQPPLTGIEDFGEKIYGARKDKYAQMRADAERGVVPPRAKLLRLGIRPDIITLCEHAEALGLTMDDGVREAMLRAIEDNDGRSADSFAEAVVAGSVGCARSMDKELTAAIRAYVTDHSLPPRGIFLWRVKVDRTYRLVKVTKTGFGEKVKNIEWADTVGRIMNHLQTYLSRLERRKEEREDMRAALSVRDLNYMHFKEGYIVVTATTNRQPPTERRGNDFSIRQIPVYIKTSPTPAEVKFIMDTTRSHGDTGDETIDAAYADMLRKADDILRQMTMTNDLGVTLGVREFRSTGQKFICKNLTKNRRDGWQRLPGLSFAGWSEAYAYLVAHFAELFNAAAEEVTGAAKPEPYYESVGRCSRRRGVDWRGGMDATEADLLKTFGLRGVQFGNYVTQRERQRLMNKAYDALRDMANVLGLPPAVIGLGGKLGLAFGARGTGGRGCAAAHYELLHNVINLTRPRGAGSLAHEWFHALDHAMGAGLPDELFDRANGTAGGMVTGVNRYEVSEFGDPLPRVVNMAYEMFRTSLRPWVARSVELQRLLKKKQGGTGYWTQPTEIGARCFETYIRHLLRKCGFVNDYLASPHYYASPYPYPVLDPEDGHDVDSDAETLLRGFAALTATETINGLLGTSLQAERIVTDGPISDTDDDSEERTLDDMKGGDDKDTEEEEAGKDNTEEEDSEMARDRAKARIKVAMAEKERLLARMAI